MPRRLTLVVHSLASGGAERVLAAMANHWAAAGDAVTVITLDAAANDECELSSQVHRVGLDLMRESRHLIDAISWNYRRTRQLANAIRASEPDHVVSFTEKMNVLTLMACRGLGLDVVIAERTDARHHEIGRVWSAMRRLTYPWCRALVVQTARVRDHMRKILPRKPIYVIPNSVNAACSSGAALKAASPREYSVLGMGRLVPSKGFDVLIDAFSRIAPRHQDWNLVIAGKGPEQTALGERVRSLGSNGRVKLAGWFADPYDVLRSADLFVMSSRYEGFPNALLEAMAAGLPVVSFDCDSGPSEIIRDDVDGVLVPAGDAAQLEKAMDRLMSDESERRRLGERARDVVRRFSVQTYYRRWDAVLRGASVEEVAKSEEGDL